MILEYNCRNISFDFLAVEVVVQEEFQVPNLGMRQYWAFLVSGKQLAELSPMTTCKRLSEPCKPGSSALTPPGSFQDLYKSSSR